MSTPGSPSAQEYGQPYPTAPSGGQGVPAMPAAPGYAQYAAPQGPAGKIRPTGMAILLCIVTLGI